MTAFQTVICLVIITSVNAVLDNFDPKSGNCVASQAEFEEIKQHIHNLETRQREQEEKFIERERFLLKELAKMRKKIHRIRDCRSTVVRGGLTLPHQKRSDDGLTSLQNEVDIMTSRVTGMEAQIQILNQRGLKTSQDLSNIGSTYVRWGSSACPSSADTVYSSQMGGGWYDHGGSPVNYLCLAPQPSWSSRALPHYHANLYGSEYDTPGMSNYQQNAVCAVCHVPRSSVITMPGAAACPQGWMLEYSGYLMTGYPGHNAASEFICVDDQEDYVHGTGDNHDGKLLYHTASKCGSLPCPPYQENRVVTCAVCSK